MSRAERKQKYFAKLTKLIEEYTQVIIVGADNVGSHHMQNIRKGLRNKGVILMGKNTMVRKVIRGHAESHPQLQVLLPYIKNNVGLIFCNGDLSGVKKIVSELRVAAPAKVGATCPNDVIVPAGPTGMEPTQTSFLQALNIPSKINKGQVDIVNDVKILVKGQRVGQSEATLLLKLNIKPFSYGLAIQTVYDNGSIYDPSVLDMTDEILLAKFASGLRNVAAVSLATGHPTIASLPHLILRGYKNLLSIAVATDYSFPKAEKIKAFLKDPNAFAAVTPAPSKGAPAPAKEEKKKEPEPVEEEETDMGLSLFD
jgi:large subunit ribosomal protein LP0